MLPYLPSAWSIVGQVSPILILNSTACQDLASLVTDVPTYTVNKTTLKQLGIQEPEVPFPHVNPQLFLYMYTVLHQAASTYPPGLIVTHSNFSSAIKYP